MNIIDERDVRTVYRKLRKKEYDDLIKLSVDAGSEDVRLLDEGMVVDAYGNPLFYIMKGTLEKYLDALPDDYVGSINLGHMDFATFPILLGKWTKENFTLVDIGDGRKGLNVRLDLDDENFIVKELKRADYDLGVSAEFGFHVNEQFTEEYGIEILDDIFISNFAIVGEAGNVNSSGIRLKGEIKMVDVKELTAALEGGEKPDLAEINKKLDALLEKQAEPEEKEEAVEETVEEAVEEAQEEPEEEEKEEAVEEAEKEPEIDLAAVLETVKQLQEEVEELKGKNQSLTEELSAKRRAEAEFVEKFKTLSVSLYREKKATEEVAKDVYTDGIGA